MRTKTPAIALAWLAWPEGEPRGAAGSPFSEVRGECAAAGSQPHGARSALAALRGGWHLAASLSRPTTGFRSTGPPHVTTSSPCSSHQLIITHQYQRFMSTVHHQHSDTTRQRKVQAARKYKPAESTAQRSVMRREDIELALFLRRRSGDRRSGFCGLFTHQLEAAAHDSACQPGPQQRGWREKEKRCIHDSDVRRHGERRAAQKDACALGDATPLARTTIQSQSTTHDTSCAKGYRYRDEVDAREVAARAGNAAGLVQQLGQLHMPRR